MSAKPNNLPVIGESVHFVAQSGRCCASIITGIYSITEFGSRVPKLNFSLYVMPADKIPFGVKNKQRSNRQEEDTLHLAYDCNRTSYQ